MNLLEIITKPFKAFADKENKRREEMLARERKDAVNVTEFAGKLCISVGGTPILPIDEAGISYNDIPDVLESCRNTWILYKRLNG